MKHNLTLPEEAFWNIHFFRAQAFFQMSFGGKKYEIVARDDVGNFIGIAPDEPTDEFLETYETNFRNLVKTLDADAFCNENTFWSTIAEEIGYGVI